MWQTHELRTPIQPILGLSEVLLSREGNIEEYHVLIDSINRATKSIVGTGLIYIKEDNRSS